MKQLLTAILCGTIILSNWCYGESLNLTEGMVYIPHELGNVHVVHDDDGFHATNLDTGKEFIIEEYRVAESVRGVTTKALTNYLECGYVELKRLGTVEDNELSVKAHVRGPGAGPFAAVLAGIASVGVIVACGVTGNAPGMVAAVYAAPAVITGAMVAPTP